MFRVIFHLDMDAFYASVEQRDHPELRGKPVIVGAPPDRRGVVCAASYEARRFGIRSAMPSATAQRLCPQAIFVPPDMERYRAESVQIMKVVALTGALIEPVSIDEAYLDFSGAFQGPDADSNLYQAISLAGRLKKRILIERGLTTSIGIAANKLLAKIASDFVKPNGLTLIPERDKILFLRPLPVRALPGVGQVTEEILKAASIFTIGDLQDDPGDLRRLIGSFGTTLKRFAFGEDERPMDTDGEIKSISSENTFAADTEDRTELRRCLREQAAELSDKLKRNRRAAQTVQIKVRYRDFTTLTRQITVEEPFSESAEIYRLACYLLGRQRLVCQPLRLIGIAVSSLTDATFHQLRLPLDSKKTKKPGF